MELQVAGEALQGESDLEGLDPVDPMGTADPAEVCLDSPDTALLELLPMLLFDSDTFSDIFDGPGNASGQQKGMDSLETGETIDDSLTGPEHPDADTFDADDAVSRLAGRISRTFLKRGDGGRDGRSGIGSKGRRGLSKPRKDDKENSSIYKASILLQEDKPYRIESYFLHLGKLQTATDIYRNLFVEYSRKKEDKETIPDVAKTQDITYDQLEDMIRIKKVNDMFGCTMERMNADLKERWELLNVFPHYRIVAMLRYTFSLN